MTEMLNIKTTLSDLINQANKIQEKCSDEIFAAKDLQMTNDLKIKGMDLSPLAAGHLCGKLQVPSRYYSRLVEAKQNKLAAENINCWLKDDSRKFMLREYDGHIRGVLSGSYSRYDAPEILTSVQEVFGDDHFKFKGGFINEERLHVRLVEKQILPIDGEDLFAGITLDSSDVGRCGLYANFFIWKQVCTNGLIIAKSSAKMFSQKHIGISHEDFVDSLKAGLENFNAIKDEVAEMIVNNKTIPDKIDLEEIMERVKNVTKLSDDDVEEVMNLSTKNYDLSNFGIVNGITEIAQKFSLERRIELETVATQLLA